MPPWSGTSRSRLWLTSLLLAALAVRLPDIGAPLLEGAAGKQTHTAMVARNLYRGSATWLRPTVDDIERPGYFVKELPLVAGVAALLYHPIGGPADWVGRMIGVVSWLMGAAALVALVRRARGPLEAGVAGFWFSLAPLGIVYSRAFLCDPSAVAAALAAVATALAWNERPRRSSAVATAALTSLAVLLKPHAALWLGPALVVVLWSRPRDRHFVNLVLLLAAAATPAVLWYAHAAAVHRAFPVPGAMVATGWVEPSLWLRPELYGRLAGQIAVMVFTPPGLILAAIGLWPPRRPRRLAERALLAWGAGVVVQSVLLGTRLFDDAARGTEYYQLPLVPVAASLIGCGAQRAFDALASRSRWAARTGMAALLAVLGFSGIQAARAAATPPARYAGLLADCQAVQRATRPDDEILVLADRGGTILYYCDRRGSVFTTATSLTRAAPSTRSASAREAFARAYASATHVYLPFPDLTPPGLVAELKRDWSPLPLGRPGIELYARKGRS